MATVDNGRTDAQISLPNICVVLYWAPTAADGRRLFVMLARAGFRARCVVILLALQEPS